MANSNSKLLGRTPPLPITYILIAGRSCDREDFYALWIPDTMLLHCGCPYKWYAYDANQTNALLLYHSCPQHGSHKYAWKHCYHQPLNSHGTFTVIIACRSTQSFLLVHRFTEAMLREAVGLALWGNARFAAMEWGRVSEKM